MILTTDSRPSPSAKKSVQRMKRQAETGWSGDRYDTDHRQQTNFFSQMIQTETRATNVETGRDRKKTDMILNRDSRQTPSVRRSRKKPLQRMKRQAETDDRQI
jgi:hypothetical protein